MARPGIGAVLLIAALVGACTAAATPGPNAVPTVSPATAAPGGSASAAPGGSAGTSAGASPTDSGGRPTIPAVSLPVGSPGALPATVLEPVLADASARSGVPRAELVVVTAVSRTWPDGSLGCPVPGMMYIQVVLEGYQVIVRAGATLYDYRGAGTTTFRLCKAIPG